MPLPEDLDLPKNLCSMLKQLMCKDPSQRCTLDDLARNNWITRDGREPLVLPSKEHDNGMQATGFEISNAMGFATIVRLKTRMKRLVASARKKNQNKVQEAVMSPSTLRRRSGTNSIVANASDSGMSTSLTSYRSTKTSKVSISKMQSQDSYAHVSVTGSSDSSSDDDFGDEEIVTLENGKDLEQHLTVRNKRRRRYSEVIPGRVDLTGIVNMRRDCVNLALRFVTATKAHVNGKPSMEDRHMSIALANSVLNLPPGIPPIAYFGVYDGHSGSDCADFIRINLHQHIFRDPAVLMREPEATLIKAYEDCDEQWLNIVMENKGQCNYSGSTSATVLLWANKLIIASAGDTRAVLARNGTAIDLTTDHIPTLQSETERIHRAGGSIVRGRVQGVLGVSRSFGDIEFKTLKEKSWGATFSANLVSATPEVKVVEIMPEDEFIIIGSDGLFDIFTSQQTIGRFKAHLEETGGNVPKSLSMLVQDAVDQRPGHDNVRSTFFFFFMFLFFSLSISLPSLIFFFPFFLF